MVRQLNFTLKLGSLCFRKVPSNFFSYFRCKTGFGMVPIVRNKNATLRKVGYRWSSKRNRSERGGYRHKKRALCCLGASRCAASYRFSSATTLAQLANLSASCVHAVSVRRYALTYYRPFMNKDVQV